MEKSFGDRLIFRAEKLEVQEGDRIGIVGHNGTGKTTLMRVLAQELDPDDGEVRTYAAVSYIPQLPQREPNAQQAQGEQAEEVSAKSRQEWGIQHVHSGMSGGEQMRLLIASALEKDASILFADEPTSHLDIAGTRQVEDALRSFRGAVVLISHDRELLDTVCTKIWEVENGTVTEYKGNYTAYQRQKELLREREWAEYEAYEKEKQRLIQSMYEAKQRSTRIKDTPKRMGNSEARLHKRKANGKREKIDQAAKALETRLAKLERKEKPRELPRVKFDLAQEALQHGRAVFQCQDFAFRVGERTLFSHLSFTVRPGQKIALIGANGTGKSTLLSLLAQRAEGIFVSQSSKLGYFTQSLSILEPDQSVLSNVKKESRYDEATIKNALARLLIRGDAVYKPVSALSGGERVKVALAKIFLGDYNVLLLDEPTNYLDIATREELEILLQDYPGTVLFATHDRRLIQRLANGILSLDEKQPALFNGTYEEYTEKKQRKQQRGDHRKRDAHADAEALLLLETKLSELLGRLSAPPGSLPAEEKELLEKAYRETLSEYRKRKQ
jgi:macrolide transport system ATP-binding/permease protein